MFQEMLLAWGEPGAILGRFRRNGKDPFTCGQELPAAPIMQRLGRVLQRRVGLKTPSDMPFFAAAPDPPTDPS